MTKIITRIAPSPTGMMHIGTARTALFNYLFARKHGGEFKIRIEDTDASRNDQDAIAPIFKGLNWLGLDYDGDVVYQSQNAGRHVEVVNQLLADGNAYECYLTVDETTSMKTKGNAFRSPYRDPENLDAAMRSRIGSDHPKTIRLKGPLEGDIVVTDLVRGDIVIKASNLDDMVLLRSDGKPVYNLAVTVDDHDMGVTHVIRGDDHIINASRQQVIYSALGWVAPKWAHIPLIHDQDGKKLSKRTGTAVALTDFEAMGYSPDAMFNYLCRLGWGGNGADEVFDREYAIGAFDLSAVVPSPARLDTKKLDSINGVYMKNQPLDEIKSAVAAHLSTKLTTLNYSAMARAIPHMRDSYNSAPALGDAIMFAVKVGKIKMSPKAKTAWDKGDLEMFKRFVDHLTAHADWDSPQALGDMVHKFVEDNGFKMRDIGPLARAALTGETNAPEMGVMLYSIGRETALRRLSII